MQQEWCKIDEDPPSGVEWRFWPKRPGGKVSPQDIHCELFEAGMYGDLFAILIRVRDEFPADQEECVDVLRSDEALKALAGWEGKEIVQASHVNVELKHRLKRLLYDTLRVVQMWPENAEKEKAACFDKILDMCNELNAFEGVE